MKNTETLFKGVCATCVCRLMWHEVWAGKLIYHGPETTTVVGTLRKLEGRETPRAFCKEHSEAAQKIAFTKCESCGNPNAYLECVRMTGIPTFTTVCPDCRTLLGELRDEAIDALREDRNDP